MNQGLHATCIQGLRTRAVLQPKHGRQVEAGSDHPVPLQNVQLGPTLLVSVSPLVNFACHHPPWHVLTVSDAAVAAKLVQAHCHA